MSNKNQSIPLGTASPRGLVPTIVPTLMIAAFAILTLLAFFPYIGQDAIATARSPAATLDPDRQPGGNYIHDGSFGGVPQTVGGDSGAGGRISGDLTDGWVENSGWSNANVRYSIDHVTVHGGDVFSENRYR